MSYRHNIRLKEHISETNISIPSTRPCLKRASFVAEKYGVAKLKPSTLNSDKYKIMKQRNWSADISEAKANFGFNPRFSLEEGIKITVAEYKKSVDNKN